VADSTLPDIPGVNLTAVEAVIREHAGVREVALSVSATPEGERLLAYVVPDYSRLDRIEAGGEEERKRVRKFGRLFDLALRGRNAEPGHNFLGWRSSYTKDPIPDLEMQEWVDVTAQEILSLGPSEVLEIGCGSGLLLLRLARGCERYVGIDVSAVSLQSVRKQMDQLEGPWDGVTLLERQADDLDSFGEHAFDTVIINSVAQYLPSASYLTRVLESAVRAVRPGGAIFIGDVRSLPLLEAFALSVELYQSHPTSLLTALRDRLQRRIDQEAELVISPAFFLAFHRRLPKVSRIEIKVKRGQFENEMIRFRYDAVLHLGPSLEDPLKLSWLDAEEERLTLERTRQVLDQQKPETLAIARVANARVEKDVEALRRLPNWGGHRTVEDFKEELGKTSMRGISPQAIWSLGDELGYQVDLSWLSSRTDGSYDVLFRRLVGRAGPHRAAVEWPGPTTVTKGWPLHVNDPGRIVLRQDLAVQLDELCKRRLPGHMVPASFVILDALPLAPQGLVG
jgi:SAM-dependent methyltransferase